LLASFKINLKFKF